MKLIFKVGGLIVFWVLAAALLVAQTCTPGGGMNCTPNLNLFLPPSNYANWNTPLNQNFTKLDTLSTQWLIPSSVNTGEVLIKSASGIGSIPGFVYSNNFLDGTALQMRVGFIAAQTGVSLGVGAGFFQTYPYNPVTGGLSTNLLACLASDGTAHVCPSGSGYWNGLTVSVSAPQQVVSTIIFGYANCLFDNTAVLGDFVTISTTTAGRCHDSGPSLPTSTLVGLVTGAPSGGVAQVGLARSGGASSGGAGAAGNNGEVQINNAGAQGAIPGLVYTNPGGNTPFLDGRSVSLSIAAGFVLGGNMGVGLNGGYQQSLPYNGAVGGLSTNLLACIQSDGTAHVCPTNTAYWSGLAYGVSAPQSVTTVYVAGSGSCLFDNAAVIGDFVVTSTTTAGQCHDTGSTTPPGSGTRVGQVLGAPAAGVAVVFLMR